jgi:hypothetical protein
MVKTVCLDSMLDTGRPARGLLKIDVGGAEVLVSAGTRRLLQEHYPTVVLKGLNEDARRGCVAVLNAAGCTVRQIVRRHLRDLSDGAISYGYLLAMPAVVDWPVGD